MKKTKKMPHLFKTAVSLMLSAVIFLSTASTANAAVLGIDVSKYQGGINWGAVAGSGVSYAFIRVGSSNKGIDPAFAANVRGAQSAGIRTGVYFYTYAASVEAAINEANLVLQWIDGYHINFPVAYDIEDAVQKGLDANTVTAMCNAFCDVIASAGYHPIVYTYTNFYKRHMTGDLRYDKWIAQYSDACEIGGHAIWQASNTGSIPGIAGRVDIDYMNKDYHGMIIPVGFIQRGDYTYFYNDYRIQFGWVDFNGFRYHMDAAGHMDKGWFSDESGIYYLAPDGHALTGQNQLDKDRFYFDEMGRIQGGWITIGENRFYYDPANNCKMLTGWMGDITERYYLSPDDGHMLTGIQVIDDKSYYFNKDGKMEIGWQKINDTNYFFSPDEGCMVRGLIPGTDAIYGTSQTDGHKLVNEASTIDGVLRCFDKEGRLIGNASYTIGDVTYQCDENGVAVPVTPQPETAPAETAQ